MTFFPPELSPCTAGTWDRFQCHSAGFSTASFQPSSVPGAPIITLVQGLGERKSGHVRFAMWKPLCVTDLSEKKNEKIHLIARDC
ncbi:hypothetical protein FKM82_013280 [Ascaphus truei]